MTTKSTTTTKATRAPKIPGPSLTARVASLEDRLEKHQRRVDYVLKEMSETCKALDASVIALNRDVIDLQQAAVKADEHIDHLREWEAAIVAKTAVYDAAVTDLTAVEEDCKRLWEQNTERVEDLEQHKREHVVLNRSHLKLRLMVLRIGKELQAHLARRWWKPWAKPAAALPTKEEVEADGQ